MYNGRTSSQQGFTIVELVIVIILLGILSYSAIPLFATKSSYSSKLAADQLVSQLQLAQRVALGMSAQATPVSVAISVTSSVWQITVQKTGQSPFTVLAEPDGLTLQVDGTTLTSGDSISFTWTASANLTPYQDHEIVISGANPYRVCLSAAGYAYVRTGACL